MLEKLPQDVLLVDYTSRSSDVVYPLFHANFTIIFAKDYQKNDPFITLQLAGIEQYDNELVGYLELGYQAFLMHNENEVYRSVSFGHYEANKDYSDHIGDIRTKEE